MEFLIERVGPEDWIPRDASTFATLWFGKGANGPT